MCCYGSHRDQIYMYIHTYMRVYRALETKRWSRRELPWIDSHTLPWIHESSNGHPNGRLPNRPYVSEGLMSIPPRQDLMHHSSNISDVDRPERAQPSLDTRSGFAPINFPQGLDFSPVQFMGVISGAI